MNIKNLIMFYGSSFLASASTALMSPKWSARIFLALSLVYTIMVSKIRDFLQNNERATVLVDGFMLGITSGFVGDAIASMPAILNRFVLKKDTAGAEPTAAQVKKRTIMLVIFARILAMFAISVPMVIINRRRFLN